MKKILPIAALLLAAAMPAAAQQNTRTALLHMKSGEVKEFNVSDLDSITFTQPVDYDKVVQCKYGMGVYYGDGEYYTVVSTDSLDPSGYPTRVGQVSVFFYAIGAKSVYSPAAILPSGRYVAATSFAQGTLYQSDRYLYAFECTAINDGKPTGKKVAFDLGAEANVEYKSDGTYAIDIKGRSSSTTEGFSNVHLTFDGTIAYANKDASYYERYDHDYNFVPKNLSAGYTAGTSYGDYSCSFYTVPLDSNGYTIGAGELMNVELLTKPDSVMNLDDLLGEYKVTSAMQGPYEPGRFLEGINYNMYGTYVSIGTYINEYNDEGYVTPNTKRGFVKDGKVTVTKDGDKYRFVCDLVLENGYKLTMDYSADKSCFVNRAGAPAARTPMVKSRDAAATATASQPAALRLVKVSR